MTIDSASPAATEAAGAELARELRAGDVVMVGGELGSGKTTFVRGACRALGVRGAVTSPTFTIGQVYAAESAEVAHLDLHRIASPTAEDLALLDDYLTAQRIGFVEWPGDGDAAAGAARLPRVRSRVVIDHAGGDRRAIRIE